MNTLTSQFSFSDILEEANQYIAGGNSFFKQESYPEYSFQEWKRKQKL